MKNSWFHKIFAITFSVLLLVSSSGLAMDMHYCMERLQDFSIFGKAKSCAPFTLQKQHDSTATQHVFKKALKSCCHDTTITLDTSDDEFSTTQEITLPQHQISFLVSLVHVFFLPTYEFHSFNFYTYRPPPLYEDITILTQHFLC